MSFSVDVKDNNSIIRCMVEKLDTMNAPDLKSQFVLLSKNGDNNLIVDLSQVKYCDSSGLSALLVGNRLAKENKGKLIIFGLQSAVEKIISISQLDTVFQIVLNEENALLKS